MTEDAPILLTVEGTVATVTLNRPAARNALDEATARLLLDALLKVEQDDAVRVVVLRGAGEHFAAGGDVKTFARLLREEIPERRQAILEELVGVVHEGVLALRRMPKPVLASVRGATAGGGFSLMLAADLVLAAEDAVFTLAFCHIGTSPDGGSTWHLPRIVGLRRAFEIALLGDRFDVATAERLGLVNRVVPVAALEAETAALAARLAAGPTGAYARTKALLNAAFHTTLADQLAAEAGQFLGAAAGPEFAEGVTAFAEKRKPRFAGD